MMMLALHLVADSHFMIQVTMPPPSADFSLSGQTPPTLPIAPPALLLFAFQLVYSLRMGVIYTGRRGVGASGAQ